MLTVKLRYKEPDGRESKPLNVGVVDARGAHQNASDDFKFASAVAQFGMLLRDSRYKGQASYDGVLRLARSSAGADLRGYRSEFVKMVEVAQALSARERAGR
jgi:Ca-activated chloride channel family protein